MNFEGWLSRTYFVERFLGVLVYVLLVAIVYFLLKQAKTQKSINRILTFTLIAVCVMAFFYIPGESADLYQWRELYKRYWEGMSFSRFWTGPLRETNIPLAYLIIFVCETTGIEGLLPTVAAFGYFYCAFRVIGSSRKVSMGSTSAISTSFLFFMSAGSFLVVISSMRSFVSFALLAYCIYTETVEKRFFVRNIPLYVFAVLLHLATIPIILLRILCYVIMIFIKKKFNVVTLVIVSVASVVGAFFGSRFITDSFEKANSYLTTDKYSNMWEYIVAFLLLVVMIFVIVMYYRTRTKEQALLFDEITVFLILSIALSLIFVYEYSIFHRFIIFSLIIAVPTVTCTVDNLIKTGKSSLVSLMRVVLVLVLFVACVRGDLSAYKFLMFS